MSSLTHCRFYEAKYPEVEELVMVNVKQIAEMGAYVKLLEYDDTDGMILLSELSRRRIRSVQKLIRVGRNEVAVVLRVDRDKGYIDLSKRRVSPEDVLRCEERYNKSRGVHSILRHVAEKTGTPLEQLYRDVGWPLQKKFGHALDAFRLSITDPDTVWDSSSSSNNNKEGGGGGIVPPKELTEYIANRLTPQPIKVRADVEVTCFGYEGIDAIKTALKAAEQVDDDAVKVRLVAPPLYVMTCQTSVKGQGTQVLE